MTSDLAILLQRLNGDLPLTGNPPSVAYPPMSAFLPPYPVTTKPIPMNTNPMETASLEIVPPSDEAQAQVRDILAQNREIIAMQAQLIACNSRCLNSESLTWLLKAQAQICAMNAEAMKMIATPCLRIGAKESAPQEPLGQ